MIASFKYNFWSILKLSAAWLSAQKGNPGLLATDTHFAHAYDIIPWCPAHWDIFSNHAFEQEAIDTVGNSFH